LTSLDLFSFVLIKAFAMQRFAQAAQFVVAAFSALGAVSVLKLACP
jgi:hypothetical protein